MLPEFMNLLRKFYFMRAAARNVKIKIILFDRLKGRVKRPFSFYFHSTANASSLITARIPQDGTLSG